MGMMKASAGQDHDIFMVPVVIVVATVHSALICAAAGTFLSIQFLPSKHTFCI
jgi:hypothetical protein